MSLRLAISRLKASATLPAPRAIPQVPPPTTMLGRLAAERRFSAMPAADLSKSSMLEYACVLMSIP